jgi:hypothetical protein
VTPPHAAACSPVLCLRPSLHFTSAHDAIR